MPKMRKMSLVDDTRVVAILAASEKDSKTGFHE